MVVHVHIQTGLIWTLIFPIGFYWTKCRRPLKKWSLLVWGFMDADCPMITKFKISYMVIMDPMAVYENMGVSGYDH